MARANSKKVDSQPTREHEIFGFDPLGADVNIPLGSLIDLVSYNHAGMSYKGDYDTLTKEPYIDATNLVLTGSISTDSSISVVGLGTFFTRELVIGDSILVNGETRVVYEITDDLNLKVSSSFNIIQNDPSPERVREAITTTVGDVYNFKEAGNFYSKEIQAGSVLIAKIANSQAEEGWIIINSNIPTAMTSLVLGSGLLFNDIVQAENATTVSSTTSRTYGVQNNSLGQLVVNVPWIQGSGVANWNLEGDTGTPEAIVNGESAKIQGGTGISTNTVADNTLQVILDDTAVTPGVYTNVNLTVDQQGRLTAVSSGNTTGLSYTSLVGYTSYISGVFTTVILQNDTGKTYTITNFQSEFIITPNTAWTDKDKLFANFNGPVTYQDEFAKISEITTTQVWFKVHDTATDTSVTEFEKVMFELRIYP